MSRQFISKCDDLFSAALVDNLYLWFRTMKLDVDFVWPTVDEDQVTEIIKRRVVQENKCKIAAAELIE